MGDDRAARRATILLIGCLLLAGCSAGGPTTLTPGTTPTPGPSPDPTPDPTSAPTASYDNPWNEAVVEVYVRNPTDRDHRTNVHARLTGGSETPPRTPATATSISRSSDVRVGPA